MADQTSKASKGIEIGVIVVEAILLLGFSVPLWAERVDAFPDESEAVVVRVIGEQFAWNVHYPGADGVFGASSPDLINVESNPLGIDRSDPNAKDDITTVNQLHIPVDRPVIVHVGSKDVIHSFGVNELRVKQDAVPGLSIPLWFVPTVTTAEMREIKVADARERAKSMSAEEGQARIEKAEGFNYEISCNQLCGLGHYRMRGYVTIHEPEEFQAWLDEQASYLGGDVDEFWD